MDPKRTPKPGPGAPYLVGSPLAPGKKPGASPPGAAGGRSGAPAAPARRPAPGISDALDQLDRDIQKLRVDFERFFNGGLPFPPEDLRGRIQAQLRNFRGMSMLTAVDSFRLGDCEARFNTYNELFNRRLRDAEEGRQPVRHAAPPAPRRYDPEAGMVFGDGVDSGAVEALYQGLVAAPGDSPRFDLDSFQTYLTRQVAAIREKTGCTEVQFRLATEDGKVKLKARPVAARAGK